MGEESWQIINFLDSIPGSGICVLPLCLIVFLFIGGAIAGLVSSIFPHEEPVVKPKPQKPRTVRDSETALPVSSSEREIEYKPGKVSHTFVTDGEKPYIWQLGLDRSTSPANLVFEDHGTHILVRMKGKFE